MERDGGNAGRNARGALYRVTDTSDEEGSRWSLKTLGHGRRDTARSEGSVVVSELDRGENKGLRRHSCGRAARSTGAAFVHAALGDIRLSWRRVVDRARMGVSVPCRSMGTTYIGVGMGMRRGVAGSVVVLTHAAGNHRRRSEALHRQSDCEQEHQSQTNKPPHVCSLSDRRQTHSAGAGMSRRKTARQAVDGLGPVDPGISAAGRR